MTARHVQRVSVEAGSAGALDDAIHALAQPLTALLFLLEPSSRHAEPPALLSTLEQARTECLRAVQALGQVRAAAHPSISPGDLQ